MRAKSILALILCTFLVTGLPAQKRRPKRPPPIPTTAEIKAFVTSLEVAHKAREEGRQLKLLGQAVWMNDARVSKVVGRYLDMHSKEVLTAALHALRYHENKVALKLLISAAGRREIQKDEDCMVKAWLALGQHGEKSAVPALIDNLWTNPRGKVFAARCNALAHIRHKESVDALIKMLRMGKAPRRGGNQKKKGAARGIYRALFLLTGENLKPEAHLWKRWWSQNRAKFEIPDQPSSLSEKQARQWKKLWNKPRRDGKKDGPRKRRRKKQDDG